MATHKSVAVLSGKAGSGVDISAAIGTVTGVAKNGSLGFNGTAGGVTDRPIMGIAGFAVTIDDATYVDPDDGGLGVGAGSIHTGHYPNSDSRFANEAP